MRQSATTPAMFTPTIRSHLAFTVLSGLVFLVLFSLLRVALFIYNTEQIGTATSADFIEAFINGVRFDLRVSVFACLPLLLCLFSLKAMAARRAQRVWLTVFASFCLFLGVVELDFYREFHQRLNSLVFQYMSEDPQTVGSMIWYGFPVARYLLAWAFATLILKFVFKKIDLYCRPAIATTITPRYAAPLATPSLLKRSGVFLLCLIVGIVAARGTLRQGPPLRWGDAFTTESMFANQLGLNGTLSLFNAAINHFSSHRSNTWKSKLETPDALTTVRKLLLTTFDKLVDTETAAIRRDFTPPTENTLPIRNVIVILMESFAGRYVGALGSDAAITPYFDELAKEGLLFDRYFSNGTHTHQGMFATMACFPNLPAFEYLMRMPEGSHKFSGLPQLLSARDYDDLYVYNGNFQWDNQSGFFSNQGMTKFIGRENFINPVFSDPTWGVSDQDMFDRAAEELQTHFGKKPFYALLQSLSNHVPYALPKNLPVEPVTGHGTLNLHLTAMRYSDWALGQFFEKAKQLPYFNETLFVIVGDHGFATDKQLTEMDLFRFNVPLLLIGPGIQEKFGARRDTVGTQIDIVPTIMGRLGGEVRHQCWGRDLLNLPADDKGFGVIKPSGSDQTVAILSGDHILIKPKDGDPRFYQYQLGANPSATLHKDGVDEQQKMMLKELDSFLHIATKSLLDNTAGVVDSKPK
jgi:phosphoglycerol transferase MdoB-like AlkP superfamily enzyme